MVVRRFVLLYGNCSGRFQGQDARSSQRKIEPYQEQIIQLNIKSQRYAVVAKEMLSTSDPDDLAFLNGETLEIELLVGQSIESALLAVSRQYVLGCLGSDAPPESSEAFVNLNQALIVDFFEAFSQQGGKGELATTMGVPFEGNEVDLEAAGWKSMSPAAKRRFIIRHAVCFSLTDAQYEIFVARGEAAKLDPLRGDVWPAVVFDEDRQVRRVEARTTIKAIRRIGQASPNWGHTTDQEFCAKNGEWMTVWNDDEHPPYAARCGILRRDTGEIMYTVCRWDDYAQHHECRDGTLVLNRHWKVRGPVCIGKCAEAAAYGRALPECDGIYLAEQTQGGRKKHARVLEQRATSRELDRDFLTLENNLGCRASHALATTVSEKDYVDEHEIDRDAKLLALIAQSAPMMSSQQRRAFLAEFREHAETFEDDNPDLFAAKVVEDVTRRVRLRRA